MAMPDHVKVLQEDFHHMLAFSIFYAMNSPMPYNHQLADFLARTYWEKMDSLQRVVLVRRLHGWVGDSTETIWVELLNWMESRI